MLSRLENSSQFYVCKLYYSLLAVQFKSVLKFKINEFIHRYKLIRLNDGEDLLLFSDNDKDGSAADMSTYFASQTVDRFKLYTLLQPLQNVP